MAFEGWYLFKRRLCGNPCRRDTIEGLLVHCLLKRAMKMSMRILTAFLNSPLCVEQISAWVSIRRPRKDVRPSGWALTIQTTI